MLLTRKGRNLQAKAEAGTRLVFTRVKVGDGRTEGIDYDDLNDLESPQKDLTISSIKAEDDGLCRVRTHFTNIGLEAGVFVYEMGLFANDPDEGEILYGVTRAIEPDFLPPFTSATKVNHQFDIVIIVGNATEIHAEIPTDGYVSRGDFDEWTRKIERILIQMEIDGRVPESNKGTFYDKFDGETSRMTFLDARADLTESVEVGATELSIVMTKGMFAKNTEAIIMDDENIETVVISDIDGGTITVSALENSYKKGAIVTRSTAVVDTNEEELKFPDWGTYSIVGVN